MKKKLFKYIKFLVSLILILSLVAPSYASLSASDGSAFVTKAEFDSALADFNARLTTFEAGINSKIDSQVTSYLDRNGIWSGKDQTFWKWWEDSHYNDIKINLGTQDAYKFSFRQFNADFSPFAGAGSTFVVPLIENVSKSGLLQYYIPCLWWEGNGVEMHLRNRMWTFMQTSSSNLAWSTNQGASAPISLQANGETIRPINATTRNAQQIYTDLNAPYIMNVLDVSVAKVKYNSFTFPMSADANRLQNTLLSGLSYVNTEAATPSGPSWKLNVSNVKYNNTTVTSVFDYYTIDSKAQQQLYYAKNPLTQQLWGWDATEECVTWLPTVTTKQLIDQMTLVSGFVFVEKGKPLLFAPGAAVISYYTNQEVPVTDNWVRTSGTSAVLRVY